MANTGYIYHRYTSIPVANNVYNKVNELYSKTVVNNNTPIATINTKNVATQLNNLPNTATLDSDEAFARMLQDEEYANFAQEENTRLNQTYNDLILAKKLQQESDDEAFARMLQEQDDADFAYALSLQFEEADMIGASASYAGLGEIGHDYYNAFYAA